MLCAISIDLDEIHHYHAIHGLAPPQGAGDLVYRVALPRFEALSRRLGLPLTFFAVGADMAIPENPGRLRALASAGHEIGNHSLDHRYDLVTLSPGEQLRQIGAGREVLQGATGARVEGFRAPGYTVTDDLLALVASTGHRYDSSVFPCAPYLLARRSVLAWMRLRGQRSASVPGDLRVALAPTSPYCMGKPYWTKGPPGALQELPIQVTPGPRLPVIGTSLLLAPAPVALGLLRACAGQPLINLELHGIDLLGSEDGLDALRPHQPDARLSLSGKLDRLVSLVSWLREAGGQFVTLGEAARRFAVG